MTEPQSEPAHFSLRDIDVAALLVSLWAVGVALIVLKLVIGLLWASRIVRRATPLSTPEWKRIQDEVSTAFRLRRDVSILKSDETAVASTLGILHARILVPLDAESWSPQRIRLVLLHELAACEAQRLPDSDARAIRIGSPLVQSAGLAGRNARITAEQERTCDDLFSRRAPRRSSMQMNSSEWLARSARSFFQKWVTLAMASKSDFRERIAAILDQARSRHFPTRGQYAGIALTVAVFTVDPRRHEVWLPA